MDVKEWAKQVFIPYGHDVVLVGGVYYIGVLSGHLAGAPEVGEFTGKTLASVMYAYTLASKMLSYDSTKPPNYGYYVYPQYGPWKKKAKDLKDEGYELMLPDFMFDIVAETNAFTSNRLDRMLNDVYKKIREKNG